MQQFWSIKDQHKDCIILFRMGDFYETFEKDAEITSEILGIALTKGQMAQLHVISRFSVPLIRATFI